jgi:hypothetical protein
MRSSLGTNSTASTLPVPLRLCFTLLRSSAQVSGIKVVQEIRQKREIIIRPEVYLEGTARAQLDSYWAGDIATLSLS